MRLLGYVAVNIVETFLRLFPFPCKIGLIRIGNPGSDSPVFLTCNYHLTVQRVKRALRGMDTYLLVANSRGINVWCAVAGGHFTNHDVISVLKTSGIEELVKQRKVILPQLAATGIEAKIIKKKTGWRVIWGPVYAKDIPVFLRNRLKKNIKMKEVDFSLLQRFEMAVSWAFLISLFSGIIALIFFPGIFIPLILFIWGLSFAIFLSYPLYHSWLSSGRKSGTFSLFFWGIILLVLAVYSLLVADFSWRFFIRWAILSFIFIFILSMDLKGSTPFFSSVFLEDRWLGVSIDEHKCKGAAFCEDVCPRNCYEVDRERRVATMPRVERCVKCGACVVQCPFDALYFKGPNGEIILPETLRKYKLSFLGKRKIRVGDKG